MTPELLDLTREALVLALAMSVPVFAAVLAAGLLAALLQTFTRLSDPALTYLPRIAAVALAVLFAAPWIGAHVSAFAERVFVLIQLVHRG